MFSKRILHSERTTFPTDISVFAMAINLETIVKTECTCTKKKEKILSSQMALVL